MQSKSVIGVVLAFGVAFAMLAGSGVGGMFGESPGDDPTVETLGDIGEESSLDEEGEGAGLDADVAGDDEPTLAGVAISSGQFIVQLGVAVSLLPFTLLRLGFPDYFAFPVGFVLQIIAFVGVAQFIRTGVLE